MRKAVFLDRDGVVNVSPGAERYVLEWSKFHFMPGVAAQLLRLRQNGFFLSLATNQSCVGRGLLLRETLTSIHQRMQAELGPAAFDAIYFCPHAPDAGCHCRKPSPELILRACREHGLEAGRSFMIGDSGSDIETGRGAGCRTVLCRPALPAREALAPNQVPDFMAASLSAAADWILLQDRPA